MKRCSRLLCGAAFGAAALSAPDRALAVNPLEYPDNGSVQFSRGGAWLATASDPIVTHYNPAALATIGSAFSVDMRLNYNNVCFTRTDENGDPEPFNIGPSGEPAGVYTEACNQRDEFPLTVPALAASWRATRGLGVGFALVPPAAYSQANEAWPPFTTGLNPTTGEEIPALSPQRYMTLGTQATIIYPTLSVGVEPFENFRVGAGFVAGMAVLNVNTGSIAQVYPGTPRDIISEDNYATLRVRDLFMPGAVASIHWSATTHVDVSIWGRWLDKIRASQGTLEAQLKYANNDVTGYRPRCPPDNSACPAGAQQFSYGSETVKRFEWAVSPPEVRAGIRFHMPRTTAEAALPVGKPVRDPLHDDIWDIEVNGSYTANSTADVIIVRFLEQVDPATGEPTGIGQAIGPGFIPPIADQATGFEDSYGVRLGGQYNVIQDKLGLLAGAWIETRSQKPELLHVSYPGPLRGGIGGGITLRQDVIDFTFGYQYHWSAGLETTDGVRRATASTTSGDPAGFNVNNEPEIPRSCETPECAVARRQFRSEHIVNNGQLTQQAHAFSVGGVVRF